MFTQYDKLIAAAVTVGLQQLATHGLDLTGQTATVINFITAVIIPVAVWLFPNKQG